MGIFTNKKTVEDLFPDNKFLFMRHGETWYNTNSNKSAKYNPDYADSHLSDNGINQSKSNKEIFNTIPIEIIYVSPYYRALQTMSIAFEDHPNVSNIIAVVHPKIAELAGMMHEFIIDIKQNKNDFNMNSKVKVDWSLFEEHAKHFKYGENLFFMENWNLIEENKKMEMADKLNELYQKGDTKTYKEEISKIAKERFQKGLKFESYKHAYERFTEFKKYVYEKHKDSINNKEEKIIAVSHKTFISIATSSCAFNSDEEKKLSSGCLVLKNCQIAPFLF